METLVIVRMLGVVKMISAIINIDVTEIVSEIRQPKSRIASYSTYAANCTDSCPCTFACSYEGGCQ